MAVLAAVANVWLSSSLRDLAVLGGLGVAAVDVLVVYLHRGIDQGWSVRVEDDCTCSVCSVGLLFCRVLLLVVNLVSNVIR